MTPLRLIRKVHAPLVCLAIACLVSVGCRTRQETVALGEPAVAYRADTGEAVFGYYVQPTIKPDHAGWHWLIVEPDTAALLNQPPPADTDPPAARVVAVTYKGWGKNARLDPPLLEPGLPDRTPPVVGEGGLTELRFVWDQARQAVRLAGTRGTDGALMRVTPDAAVLTVREYNREAMIVFLQIAAAAGLIAGLILLGGSTEIDLH